MKPHETRITITVRTPGEFPRDCDLARLALEITSHAWPGKMEIGPARPLTRAEAAETEFFAYPDPEAA